MTRSSQCPWLPHVIPTLSLQGEGVYHIVAGELNSQHLTPEYIKAVVQFISSLLLTTSASANELRNVCAELTRVRSVLGLGLSLPFADAGAFLTFRACCDMLYV